jgi:hypothetical protein
MAKAQVSLTRDSKESTGKVLRTHDTRDRERIQTIGSKPRENRWIRTSTWYRVSGVQRLKEFLFDCRSREVSSIEGSCDIR